MALKAYRVGDLDKYQRKADSMYQMFGRSTGYFGTGYYFCTKPEYCCTMTREKDPLYKLTLKEGIKLIRGTQKLHDKLKAFNSFMINYPRLLSKDLIDKEKRFAHYAIDYCTERQLIGSRLKEDFEVWGDWADNWKEYLSREYSIREMINRAKEVPALEEFASILESDEPNFERIDEIQKENEDLFDYDYLSSMRDLVFDVLELLPIQLNTDTETIKMTADHIYETYESFYENGRLQRDPKLAEDDSFPTQLLKILGYEGVWPSDECDNTTYGGVIFDIKDFTYERIADVAKDYIKKDLREKRDYFKHCIWCGSIYENDFGVPVQSIKKFLKGNEKDVNKFCKEFDLKPTDCVCPECFESSLKELPKRWKEYSVEKEELDESENIYKSSKTGFRYNQEELDGEARDLIESPYNNLQEEDFEWLHTSPEDIEYWWDKTWEMESLERSLYD